MSELAVDLQAICRCQASRGWQFGDHNVKHWIPCRLSLQPISGIQCCYCMLNVLPFYEGPKGITGRLILLRPSF